MLIENFISRLFSNSSRRPTRLRKPRKSLTRRSVVTSSEALEARALLAATASVAITTSATPAEDDGTVPFSVTLTGSGTLDNDVSILASSAAGTATGGGTDYADFSETITFVAGTDLDAAGGSVTASRSVTLTNDQSLEVNEGFTVDLSGLSFTGPDAITTGNASFGVTVDDDEAATLAIGASSTITEEGGAQNAGVVTLTITGSGTGGLQLGDGVSITADITDATTGSGTSGTDYTAVGTQTVTFDSNAATGATQNGTIVVTNDQSLETNEGINLTLGNLGASSTDTTLGTTASAVTIDDDEAATLNIAATSTIAEESGAQASGTVTLTITGTGTGGLQLGDGISLTADITDAGGGSGTSGTDYTSVGTQTLTFDSNAVSGATQSASIAVANDQSLEVNETINLTLGNLGAAGTDSALGTTANTVTIDDDESATLDIAASSTVNEEGGAQNTGVVTLTITGSGTGGLQLGDGITLTADITDAGTGSGTGGTDYSAVGTQTVTFDSNAATGATQNATITPTNDQLLEANETVNLTLGNFGATATDASLGTTAGTVTLDDDEAATLAVATTATVTEEGGIQDIGVVTLTITGSGTGSLQLGDGISLTADLTDAGTGTATAGSDFIAPGTQTVTFDSNAATGTTQDGALVVNNDRSLENTETVRLSLGNASVAGTDTTLGNADQVVSINDDESATIAIAATGTISEEGGVQNAGTVTLTITGSGTGDLELGDGITISADITDLTTGTATAGTDYTAVGTQTLNFNSNAATGATGSATFVATNDQLLETNETIEISLGNLVTGGTDVSFGTTASTITVDDDESATLSVAANSAITEEGAAQNAAAVTLTITGSGTGGLQLGDGITLSADLVDGASGTASTGTDYTGAATQTVMFGSNAATGATQSATFTPVNDQSLEVNETIDITLGNLSAASTDSSLGTTVGTVTIDDDEAATLSVSSTSSVMETGGAQTVGVVTLTITGTGTGGLQLGDGITLSADVTDAASGTGTSVDDYDAFGTQTVTFDSNAATGATQDSMITIVNDQSLEANETVNLSLGNLSAASTDSSIGTSTNVVTIDDDESAVIDVAASSSVTEEGGSQSVATLTLTITGTGTGGLQLGSGVSVSADLTDDETGDATSGDDYTEIDSHTITFDSNAVTGATQSAMLAVTNDQSLEVNETIDLTVANLVTGGTDSSLGDTTHTITIDDDESATLDIAATSTITEEGGAQAAGVVTLTITGSGTGGLQLGPGISLTADVADVMAGTASASDYGTVGMQTVTFDSNAASGTTQAAMITPVNDQSLEAGETIELSLGNFGATETEASLGDTSSTVTIDDDEAASIDIASATMVTEAGGAQAAGMVTLTITGTGTGVLQLGDGISVTADVTDAMTGTATSVDDFDAVGTQTVTFDSNAMTGATQGTTITPVNDGRVEMDETVNLVVGNLGTDGTDSSIGTMTNIVTIEDDDDRCGGYGPGDAVTLDDGTVYVPGTLAGDVISTSETATDLRVTLNGTDTDFALGMVTRVVICGFDGADSVTLGTSHEARVDAGWDNDSVVGGPGADKIIGAHGDDSLQGFGGDDTIFGGAGNDRIEGGTGHDSLGGGSGGDTLIGNTGRDSLLGGSGKDRLIGSAGADD
ncbi:MAG: beta strand repeat-containing protein, partial [Planctomycetaceae bacterium]